MQIQLSRAVLLAALFALAATLAGGASGAPQRAGAKGIDQELAKQLRDQARGSVTISEKKATKAAGFIRAGQNGDLSPSDRSGSPSGKAKGFLERFGSLLGATGESELVQASAGADELGGTHVRYRQLYRGVPVWGAEVVARLDADNNLTSVNGVAVPDLDLDTTPQLASADAATLAAFEVASDPPTDEQGTAAAVSVVELQKSAELVVYRVGLVKGDEGLSQLAYEVEVTNGANVRDVVIVHAHTGKVLNRYSEIHAALSRRLFEGQGTSQNPLPPIQIWQEGDPFPGSLNANQQNIVNFSGDSYRFFFNAFGRDSYDGLGAIMQSVNNDPRISCPNANWNGITTNYCNGVTSDDVVAHEWGHAYTQYTHDLIYQWQPGALNESYSDIWGEVIDVLNGVGTDAPAPERDPTKCTTHTAGIPLITINSPAAIAGDCPTGGASFGPLFPPAPGLSGNVVLALDGTGPGDTSTTNGCTALTNPAAVAGNIALVDRGVCAFTVKVKNAQNAGAIAVIVANTADTVLTMGGGDPTITIPSALTTLEKGNLVKAQLASGATVNVSIKDVAPPREESYRWLVAEDSTAFGTPGRHAIRDMWNPNCVLDPGKVTDAQYHCDTSDAGGVHSNSGIPNHGFALLVEGGTYNGQTISPIGMVKAAHLYWRAQSVYQTKTSDFADHADALEASCQDLVGVQLAGLSTGAPAAPSGQAITAADCTEVTEMIAAIELRHDPTEQCNFTPLLNPNTPSVCAQTKNPPTFFKENFEDGLGGWTLTNQGVYAGWPGTNWAADSTLPGGRSGSAAFAANLDGQCDQGAGDVSGVMRLMSPAIKLPSSQTLNAPRLTFDHYIASELNFDGGNVKYRVNGGAWAIVPASAFTFNPYNTTLEPATTGTPPVPRNTNPLAGQEAFSGTDGGQVTGSWAQSQVDLSKLGIKAGDTIQFSFEFGMDGCSAIDGWYVDDVEVRACNTKKESGNVPGGPGRGRD